MMRFFRRSDGQAAVEFTIALPLLLVVALGVVETSFLMLDEHIVTKMAREAANLISRDTDLQAAGTVLKGMSGRPINFDDGTSKLVLSVVKRGATSGTSNYDKDILYQRYTYGTLSGVQSVIRSTGGTFGGAPGYVAVNSDTDTALRLVNKPANLVLIRGGLVYIAEIFTKHTQLTPLHNLGLTLPDTLYAIAYF